MFFFLLLSKLFMLLFYKHKNQADANTANKQHNLFYYNPQIPVKFAFLWQLENCNLELKAYPCNKDWLVKFYKEMRSLAAGYIWILL